MEDTIKRIYEKLTSENAEWVKQVFSATGILCESTDDGYIRLMSLCGDESLPYDWPDDELSNVDSVDSFIEYIKASELYTERLQDVSYGAFTKCELYSSILYNYFIPTNKASNDKYGDEAVHLAFYGSIEDKNNVVCIHYAVCELDETYVEITKEEMLDIDSIIQTIKEQDESMIPDGVSLAPETDDLRISIPTETAELMEYIKNIHRINQEQYKA